MSWPFLQLHFLEAGGASTRHLLEAPETTAANMRSEEMGPVDDNSEELW